MACCIYRNIICDQEIFLRHKITDKILIIKVIVAGADFSKAALEAQYKFTRKTFSHLNCAGIGGNGSFRSCTAPF